MAQRLITPNDIMPMAEYAAVRASRRREIAEMKRARRLSVGPDITFYFESFATMLHQVHEMLHIEKGGDAQLADELDAYNPLVPDGRHLIATMMVEIDDPGRRARVLRELAGIEETISLSFAGEMVRAEATDDEERTTADGKTSSVHFFRFPFTPAQIAAFTRPGTRAILAVAHPRYDHMAALPEAMRQALAADFD
jgi:hypothetical protein